MRYKYSNEEVLRYQKGRRSSKTVRRYYLKWRREQIPSIPERCDIECCKYYTEPLQWNGKKLNLILDHKDGVNGNNKPKNLRFLCPNCNSQQPTHGGKNKGKVEQSIGGFSIKSEEGKRKHFLPIETGKIELSEKKINLKIRKKT